MKKITLSDEAQALFDEIRQEYEIDDRPGLLLLQTAFEAFDEMRSAQREMAGRPVVTDRFDQLVEHPAARTIRAARTQFMAALKQLNLDLEPLRDGPGRPTLSETMMRN